MKKSLAAYIFLFAFLLSSCSSQKVATSSSSVYPTANTGHKKFVAGQTNEESGSETMRLDSLKARMAILEAQLEAIKAGESSKSKKAAQKEAAAINKEIEKVEEEVAATATTDAPKNGQKKFVAKPKTKEEIAAAKEEKSATKTPSSPAKKDTETAANTNKSKDKDNKTVETPKTPSNPAKKDTKTAANTAKKPTPKPTPKPVAPPKPQVVYKTITEKVLGNFFMDGSTSSQNMFCLHKTAPVGTQITVTNPMNGKQLTLKVLGKLPDLAEDMGVAIKITYSAARQLNLRDNRFELKCSYKMAFTVDPITGASVSAN
ncbi:MAG: hypothetical protein R3E32_20490 [Chitinophagales bacterium]